MSENETEAVETEKPSGVCSACGSSAPHHLAYIKSNGVCVV